MFSNRNCTLKSGVTKSIYAKPVRKHFRFHLISIAITQFLLTAARKQPKREKGLTNDMAALDSMCPKIDGNLDMAHRPFTSPWLRLLSSAIFLKLLLELSLVKSLFST